MSNSDDEVDTTVTSGAEEVRACLERSSGTEEEEEEEEDGPSARLCRIEIQVRSNLDRNHFWIGIGFEEPVFGYRSCVRYFFLTVGDTLVALQNLEPVSGPGSAIQNSCIETNLEDSAAANAEPSAKLSPVFVAGHDKRGARRANLAGCGLSESPCVADGITPDPALGCRQGKK